LVEQVVEAVRGDPTALLERLAARMRALAAAARYEEAALTRDRAAALAAALDRQRRLGALREAEAVEVALPGGGGVELRRGLLTRAWGPPAGEDGHGHAAGGVAELPLEPAPHPLPVPADGDHAD